MSESDSNSRAVLIMEDNASHAELVTEIFDRHFSPIIIHTVDDIEKGIGLLRDNAYDLVISDCMFGQSSIQNRFAEIKEQADVTPIIIISGVDDSQMAASLTKLGAVEYLAKTPENLDRFPSIIARYLNMPKSTNRSSKKEVEVSQKIDGIINAFAEILDDDEIRDDDGSHLLLSNMLDELKKLNEKFLYQKNS